MKIWLPSLNAASGASVYQDRLHRILSDTGYEIEETFHSVNHQFFPYFLKHAQSKTAPDVIVADVMSGAQFKRPNTKLVIIEHHCIFDETFTPFRSLAQGIVHEGLWRRYERNSLAAADAVVCISDYTRDSVQRVFGPLNTEVIVNAVETDFFCPAPEKEFPIKDPERPFRLLFVGNLIRRKGVDLLPRIMRALGPGFELHYTSGLRTKDSFSGEPNMVSLGRLSREQLRQEYRDADALLFPTRFEGFGYAPAEAMACGTPVISTRCSAIPEVVVDGETGILCPVDDVDAFVNAARTLANDESMHLRMSRQARATALERFSMERWGNEWSKFLAELVYLPDRPFGTVGNR